MERKIYFIISGILMLIFIAWRLSYTAAHNTPGGISEPSSIFNKPSLTSTPASYSWYRLYFTEPNRSYNNNEEAEIIRGLTGLIDTSQHSLDMAIYQLDLAVVTAKIIAAAERGVDIRIVTDEDSLYQSTSFIDLQRKGIPVVHDETEAIMHNKFLIVDGHTVWTGSWNMTENSTYRDDNYAIQITSPELAKQYTEEFEEMFIDRRFGSQSPPSEILPELSINDSSIETCFTPDEDCAGRIVATMKTAHEKICFMAYTLTHDDIVNTLLSLSDSGSEVRGIVESQMAESQYSGYQIMKDRGIDVLLDGNPGLLHHKVIIIDEKLVILGSYNFSKNGNDKNDENILLIENGEIAALFYREFEKKWHIAADLP